MSLLDHRQRKHSERHAPLLSEAQLFRGSGRDAWKKRNIYSRDAIMANKTIIRFYVRGIAPISDNRRLCVRTVFAF